MSAFITSLCMELMVDADGRPQLTRAGRQLYQLMAPFIYESDVAGRIEVKSGFVTDLCSQPQITLSLLGECAQEPSVPHDYLYSMQCVSRAVADKMLYEACVLTGVPRWKAVLIYLGVRLGGASHWGPDTSLPVLAPVGGGGT